MRKFLFIFLTVILAVPCIVTAQDYLAEQERVTVRITKPFTIPVDKDITAEFLDLTEKGVQFGLDGMQLHGRIEYEEKALADGSHRGHVKWHSASSTTVSNVKQVLDPPLRSQFRDDPDTRVEVGETMVAIGDLDQLAQNLQKLESSVEEKEEGGGEKETHSSTVGGLTPSSSTPSSGSTTPSPSLSVNADKQTTTYEDCEPFINEGAMQVEKQRKTIVKGESGTIYSTSMCETYAVLAEIRKKPGDCGLQWLYEDNATAGMEQWYFVDPESGDEKNVGECRESGATYPIEPRCDDALCPDYFDEPNGLVFPQCAQGAYIGGTWVPAPSGCQPQDGVSYAVEWEYVLASNATDEWIVTNDNFTDNISYPLIRKFYMHPAKGKVYLTEAVPSPYESYAHKHDTSCGWVMNNAELQAQQLSNTYIEYTLEGVVKTRELQGCEARTAPVPYAYIGITSQEDVVYIPYNVYESGFVNTPETQDYQIREGFTELTAVVVGAGASGSHAGRNANCVKGYGGNSGSILERRITVTPLETVQVTPGIQGRHAPASLSIYDAGGMIEASATTLQGSFGIHSAQPGFGTNGNVNGSDGYGDAITAASGHYYCNAHITPPGGNGYGAGGGALGYSSQPATSYGDGAPGAVIFKYSYMKYLRPDNTYHEIPYNGD